MNPAIERSTSARTVHAAPVLAVILAVLACPTKDSSAAILHADDVPQALRVAVSHFYQSKVRRRTTDASCYFDPQVMRSMACIWHSYGEGADSFYAQQEVKKQALKECKERGGQSCVLFYRNGRLRYDGLSPQLTRKIETILSRIPSYLTEAVPFPEGARITGGFRDWFGGQREYLEERRTKKRSKNLSYAICANERGIRTAFGSEGQRQRMRHVRRQCVLSCQVLAEWHSRKEPCYVIFEDGRFASDAAQRAVLQR